MSDLSSARVWLQARYLEMVREPDPLCGHLRKNTEDPRYLERLTDERCVLAQTFHSFLLEAGFSQIQETVDQCMDAGWIGITRRVEYQTGHRAVWYRILPAVLGSSKPVRANKPKLFPHGPPDDLDVKKLAELLRKNEDGAESERQKMISIARTVNKQRAKSLSAEIRRQRSRGLINL